MAKKNCVKGCGCGATCIEQSDDCIAELGPVAGAINDKIANLINTGQAPNRFADSTPEEALKQIKALSNILSLAEFDLKPQKEKERIGESVYWAQADYNSKKAFERNKLASIIDFNSPVLSKSLEEHTRALEVAQAKIQPLIDTSKNIMASRDEKSAARDAIYAFERGEGEQLKNLRDARERHDKATGWEKEFLPHDKYAYVSANSRSIGNELVGTSKAVIDKFVVDQKASYERDMTRLKIDLRTAPSYSPNLMDKNKVRDRILTIKNNNDIAKKMAWAGLDHIKQLKAEAKANNCSLENQSQKHKLFL